MPGLVPELEKEWAQRAPQGGAIRMAADGHHDHGIVATGQESTHSDRPDDPGNVPGGAPSGSPPGAARSTPSDVPTGAESGDVAQQHRLLLEHLPGAYSLHEMLWDEHGQPRDYRFLDVNPAFEDMTGLSRERVLGRTLFEVLPGIERKWVDIYGRVVSTGQSASFEHRDELMGRHWDVRAWCAGPNRFAVVFSDATRCRVMEGELRRSAAMQRAMIRNIPFDFWARDASGRVVIRTGQQPGSIGLDCRVRKEERRLRSLRLSTQFRRYHPGACQGRARARPA